MARQDFSQRSRAKAAAFISGASKREMTASVSWQAWPQDSQDSAIKGLCRAMLLAEREQNPEQSAEYRKGLA